MEIASGLKTPLPLTGTRCLTSRTLHLISLVKSSSPRSILCLPTNKFQSTQITLLRRDIIAPFGLFEFGRMPFTLRNVKQTFQQFMDSVYRGFDFIFVYQDDILIASCSIEEHHQQLFQRLSDHGLVINPAKCVFGKPELSFRSHTISDDEIRPHTSRVDAIRNFPVPTDKKVLHQFIGLINYYHRFAVHFSEILQPDDSFYWDQHAQKAFE